MAALLERFLSHSNYYGYVALALVGFYAMMTRVNLMRQLIGLSIFQASIILFFVSVSAKWGAALPIAPSTGVTDAARCANPLPHALMLTAIVVAVATLAVAMAILIRLKRELGTLEEDQLLERLR